MREPSPEALLVTFVLTLPVVPFLGTLRRSRCLWRQPRGSAVCAAASVQQQWQMRRLWATMELLDIVGKSLG